MEERQQRLTAQQRQLASEVEQRRQAEAALREREERIRMAVESADIGTWDLNVATRQRQWSDRTKTMFGLTPDAEVSHLVFADLLHPEDRDRVGRAIEKALDPAGNGGYQIEYRTQWADGTIRWILARGQVFFRGEGATRRAQRFIGTVFDFTERKQREQELEEDDRRKNEFLAVLAHELRNPLVPIRNALDVWPALDEPAASESIRRMIGRQVEQMVRLVDDLMDVSRITRGKIELRKEPVELQAVVGRALETLDPLLQARGLRLTVSPLTAPAWVDADAVRLTQVFGNILHNASKFAAPGGTVSVSLGRQAGRVQVRIRDDGVGIAPDVLESIFDPFWQADSRSNRSHGGLGIGLTLAKQIVDLHQGTIEAHSDGAGEGSEFVVTLELLAERASVANGSDSPAAGNKSGHRILVVDDVPASAETLAAVLRKRGQEVWVAFDGISAVEAALVHRPEVVLLDVAMPGIDGYEVARRLRTRPELSDVVLVALTGYGDGETYRMAKAAGFDHHVLKTAGIEALERVFPAASQRT